MSHYIYIVCDEAYSFRFPLISSQKMEGVKNGRYRNEARQDTGIINMRNVASIVEVEAERVAFRTQTFAFKGDQIINMLDLIFRVRGVNNNKN